MAKRLAAIRARFDDPEYRARKTRAIHIAHLNARKDPEKRARLNRGIWVARERLTDPDVRAKFLAGRAAAARKRVDTLLAWCPHQHREEYYRLTQRKGMRAADARRVIEARMTPFERQMLALSRGAGLVERPMKATLGGIARAA